MVNTLFTVRSNFRFISEILFFWAAYVLCYNIQNVTAGFDYMSAHVSPLNKVFIFMMGVVYASQAIVNNGVVKSADYKLFWERMCNLLSIFMALYFTLQVIIGFDTSSGEMNFAAVSNQFRKCLNIISLVC
jgi:phage-related holin